MKRYTHAKIIIHVTEPKLNKIDVRLWQIDLRFVADQASVVAPIKGNKLSLSLPMSVSVRVHCLQWWYRTPSVAGYTIIRPLFAAIDYQARQNISVNK